MYCCPNCFTDRFLKSHILAISSRIGKCDICKSTNITLINPSELLDRFEPLVDLYEKDRTGLPLLELFQSDWNIFGSTSKKSHNKLLNELTQSEATVKQKYKAKFLQDKKNIENWDEFREELMHSNRFFPAGAPDKSHMKSLGKYFGTIIEKGSQKFFRARTNNSDKAFTVREMGKPPKKLVGNGRANPVGIPYLYVASTVETAISEIRGHKGEKVSVAEYELIRDLELADLRNPRMMISPFELEPNEDDLKLLYINMPFLERLGTELSQPIIPSRANLEYLPSQYLSEMLKQIGFHGIIYGSSIADGNNYVLFVDRRLKLKDIHTYIITETKISAEPI